VTASPGRAILRASGQRAGGWSATGPRRCRARDQLGRYRYAEAGQAFPRVTIRFRDGPKSFDGNGVIYSWARNSSQSSIPTSALMALEAWATGKSSAAVRLRKSCTMSWDRGFKHRFVAWRLMSFCPLARRARYRFADCGDPGNTRIRLMPASRVT